MISRRRPSKRNDQGVVAIELVLIMPFIIVLIVCIIALAGLFSTKSRVVGAARDGARSLSLKPGVTSPNADPNAPDGITVTLDGYACPALTDAAYQTATPQASRPRPRRPTPFPFRSSGTWSNIAVTEKATMPCG